MFITDQYMSFFTNMSEDFAVDVNQGISMPLPDTWTVLNPGYSSEDMSQVVVTKESSVALSPNLQAFSIKSNPHVRDQQESEDELDLNSQGVIIVTRYHRIFDGSFHFSFKAASQDTIVGS